MDSELSCRTAVVISICPAFKGCNSVISPFYFYLFFHKTFIGHIEEATHSAWRLTFIHSFTKTEISILLGLFKSNSRSSMVASK